MILPWYSFRLKAILFALPFLGATAALGQPDAGSEVVCPRAASPVVLDGRPDEPAWKDAAETGPLVTLTARRPAGRDGTGVRVLHDDAALYLAVSCRAIGAAPARKAPRDDAGIWRRDHLEIFVNPFPEREEYCHLVVDRAGTLLDSRKVPNPGPADGMAWNGEWSAAIAEGEGAWTAEIRLPFATLGAQGVKPGDLWRLKVGRDGGRDGALMWPPNPTASFHSRVADGALYFDRQNLLANGDFEAGQGAVPESWDASLTSPEVNNQPQGTVAGVDGGVPPGKRALRVTKLSTALYWPQVWSPGYPLVPGGAYEFSALIRGTMAQVNLRANGRVGERRAKMSRGIAPGKEFARHAFLFVVPEKTEDVGVGLAAPAGVSGEIVVDNAVLRRVLHDDDAARAQAAAYAPPDFSPDKDPIHGLEALAERAGHKPWSLFWRKDHLLTWRVIFRDRRFGTDLWLLDHSPTREFGVTASIWPAWNADGSVMMLPENRLAPVEPRRPWLADAGFTRLVPMPTGGTPLWDLQNPDLYYMHRPGVLQKVNHRTGEVTTLATWQPRDRERAYGLTKDNRSVFVTDHDGGLWVPYAPGEKPLPYIQVLDCYGQAPGGKGTLPSLVAAGEHEGRPVFRILIGTRVYTDDGHTERVIVPISGHTEYLRAFAGGKVQFPADARPPATQDLDGLFRIYNLYPSCSHGHLSYSPDGEYVCWDGSATFFRARDNGDRHDVRITANGTCYHTCWFRDPRFFVTCIRSYLGDYSRAHNANLLCQVFTDGTWQPVADIKMRPAAFYYSGNFATFSQDATKIHYASTMLGVPKNYIAVMARPQPPRAVSWRADGPAVLLSWKPARQHRETRGYLVYRSERSGDAYRPLFREPVAATSYRDAGIRPGQAYHYVVTAVEHGGLESGYSAEAAGAGIGLPARAETPLVLYAEAEESLSDLGTADRPGLSTGRDRRGASNWYFLARTPEAKQGSLRVAVQVPGGAVGGAAGGAAGAAGVPQPQSDRSEKSDRSDGRAGPGAAGPAPGATAAAGQGARSWQLWLRVRREGAAAAAWQVAVDGRPAGTADCAGADWVWVRAGRPLTLAPGEHGVTLATGDAGAQADLLCLATDPRFVPAGVRPEDGEPPGPPAGLKSAAAEERGVRLQWQPAGEADLSHYNVYAAREDQVSARQECLVGSPSVPEFIDWGLRAGATYRYAITAVDRRGNESPLSAVVDARVAALAQPAQQVELRFDQGVAEGKLLRGTAPGTHAKEYVLFPGTATPAEAEAARVTWSIEVANAGRHYLWLRYLPRGQAATRGAAVVQNLGVLLDGRPIATVGGGETDLSVEEPAVRPEFWTWARPVAADLVGVDLPAGKHTLTLTRLTPEVRYDALVVTGEPSFLPPDGRLRQR